MTHPHPSLARLNTEWEGLSGLPVPGSWARPALLGHGSLGDVLAAIRGDPDGVLGALLGQADATACRVVLQAMLPKAVTHAARDRVHGLDDYLGELWLVIATYPLARRPVRIAANLALDTRKRVRARGRGIPVDPAELTLLPACGEPDWIDDLLDSARQRGVIDAAGDRVLRLVYEHGLRSAEVAAVLGVSPEVVRQRCSRALHKLAAHLAEPGYPQGLSTMGITTRV